jgi:hypothetical protein
MLERLGYRAEAVAYLKDKKVGLAVRKEPDRK